MFGLLVDPVARRRRVALDSAAAHHVIPVWEEMWWDDGDPTSPCALLSRAEPVLAGEPFDLGLYTEALETSAWTAGISMIQRDLVEEERAADAYRAAITTLRTAGGQDPFMALSIDESTRDFDIDEEGADAASWAASAMSAGIGGIDIRACREFWEWWLWENRL
jgi:Immunity protein Imm5